jgi:hypothetical protein
MINFETSQLLLPMAQLTEVGDRLFRELQFQKLGGLDALLEPKTETILHFSDDTPQFEQFQDLPVQIAYKKKTVTPKNDFLGHRTEWKKRVV